MFCNELKDMRYKSLATSVFTAHFKFPCDKIFSTLYILIVHAVKCLGHCALNTDFLKICLVIRRKLEIICNYLANTL
jgi:hypothetical protein